MKIQFYILNTINRDKISSFICQLVEKVYNKNHRIQLMLKTPEELKHYDDAIWSYKMQESFLAHLPETELNENVERIPFILSTNSEFIMSEPDILISTDASYVANEQFSQALYIVDSNEETVAQARALYRQFTANSNEIVTHKISL